MGGNAISQLQKGILLIIFVIGLLFFAISFSHARTHNDETPAPAPPPDSAVCNPCNSSCVSVSCQDPQNCGTETCLDQIQAAHSLTTQQYNQAILAYYTTHTPQGLQVVVPVPKVIPRQEIEVLVDGACNSNRIKFDLNEADLTTHNYLYLYKMVGHEKPESEDNTYSVSFFKAMLRDQLITEFRISRAMVCPDHTKSTIAIAVAYSTTATPVYYGDLTDVYP